MFGKLCGGTFVRRITMYLNALGGGGIRLGVNGIDVRSERIKQYIILQPVLGVVRKLARLLT